MYHCSKVIRCSTKNVASRHLLELVRPGFELQLNLKIFFSPFKCMHVAVEERIIEIRA